MYSQITSLKNGFKKYNNSDCYKEINENDDGKKEVGRMVKKKSFAVS